MEIKNGSTTPSESNLISFYEKKEEVIDLRKLISKQFSADIETLYNFSLIYFLHILYSTTNASHILSKVANINV